MAIRARKPRIGVIVNPESKENRGRKTVEDQLRKVVGGAGVVHAPQGLEALEDAVQELHREEVSVLAMNGGDGTVHKTVTAMVRAWGDDPLPMLANLRGGTNNTIARGLGIRGRPAEILEAVASRELPTKARTLLCLDGQTYGFMLSNGLFDRYLRAYYEGEPSMFRAGVVLAQATASAVMGTAFAKHLTSAMPVTVTVDGEEWPDLGFMTVPAGTVDDIGLGFIAFPNAPKQLGKLEVLGIGCSAFNLAFQLPRFYRGLGPGRDDIRSAVCSELVLSSDTPIPCHLDGDAYEAGCRVVATPGPIVSFLVP
jgi:diacylglycerol kinase (ATP)